MATDRASEAATLSALLESLPGPALLVDLGRRVRAVNAAFRARVPRPGGTVDAHCYELLHGRRRRCASSKGHRCPLDLCVGTGAPVVAVHSHVAGRRTRRERALLRPLVDGDGKVVACLATLEPLEAKDGLGQTVTGKAPIAVAAVRAHLPRLARARSAVLLFGEAGTGKASVARAIHGLSRSHGPFEERSGCELTAEGLRGFLASGSGGTLYLGDLHALDREAQDALWEWLTRHAGRRRLILGTDRDLAERAAAGLLRADLLARLALNTLRLPPLRNRTGELTEIAAQLLRKAEGPGRTLSPGAVERLRRHPFPGNLDELGQALSHASLMATGPTVRAEDLPDWVGSTRSAEGVTAPPGRRPRDSSGR